MLNSVNQIRVELQEIANAHLQINDFFWGDFLRAYKENTELNYVLMGCFYPTATLLNNQTQLTLTIYICDRVYKDYSNLNDVESDTLQICRDVYNVINSSFRWKRIGRVQGATCQKFIERGGDEVAGHTLTIQFLLRDKSGICELPMQGYDFDQPAPAPGECEPAELMILDTDGSTLYSLSLLSGSTNNQTIQDATWTLENTVPTTLLTGSILAEGSTNITAPDATLHIKAEDDGTITNIVLPSGVNDEYIVANSDIEVNGNYEFFIHATQNYDIRLRNESNQVITPVSVTPSANHATIVINTAPPVGATLMKTGQNISYRTGDDGDIEAGRDVNFFTLASNNPFGNSNRFTDILGGQTYTNNWIIDWSTYNGSNVLGWYRIGVRSFIITWGNAIDFAISETFGTFSNCRIPNKTEAHSIINSGSVNGLAYSPFNFAGGLEFWTSTTNLNTTGQAFTQIANGFNTARSHSNPQFALPCRTFTVNGTILT